MSTRRETVYWHGCPDASCEMESHGCARIELWIESPIDRETIGYMYDEAIHCPRCAEARFDAATLSESREIGHLVPGDQWWDATAPGCQALSCGTCAVVIDESHDDQACGCSAGEFRGIVPLAINEDGPPLKLTA